MAIYNTPDGRQVVGSVESGNDYHGFNGKRDIIIQLTADGATEDALNALEYLKAYAIEQNKQGNPIFPNGTRVWISANGYTKAVEADDIVIDGDNITIGGIKWNGTAWDYSEAGQTGGALPPITDADDGKVLTANSGVWGAQYHICHLYATVDADGYIGINSDGDNPASVADVMRLARAGYDFGCNFSISGGGQFNAMMRVVQIGAPSVTLSGEYIDYLNDNARYEIVFEAIDDPDDGHLSFVGIMKPLGDFIVTLTPTAADYSGTMDKTVAEIDAAYKAGRKIVFALINGSETYTFDVTITYEISSNDYASYGAITVFSGNLIAITTPSTSNGDTVDYYTSLYPLTPAT